MFGAHKKIPQKVPLSGFPLPFINAGGGFPSTGDVNLSKLPKLPHIGNLFGTTHFKQCDGRDEYCKPRQCMTDAYIKPSTVCDSRRRTLKCRELFQLFIISTSPSLLLP
jgi:hypothetical protein